MLDITTLTDRYRAWLAERERLSGLESDPDGPARSNEWQWSDDEAVNLLHEMAGRYLPPERLPWPGNGVCVTCGSVSYHWVETGLVSMRDTNIEDDGSPHAWADGWDDMSEGGDDAYIECQACNTFYEVPETLEFD